MFSNSKMKGLIAIILAVFMFTSLTACGGKTETPEDLGASSSSSTTPPEPQIEELIPADQLLEKGMMLDGFSYTYVLTMPDQQKITHKMWVKGGNMRSEMDNPAGGEKILSIINTDEGMLYLYQPEIKQAFKMPIENSEVDVTSPKDYAADSDTDNMVFMKREVFDGKECLVYETSYEGGKGKIWIWEEGGMPLRVETQVGQDLIVAEFLDFTVGNIDDSLFKFPDGTQIMDFGAMMP